MKSIPQKMFVQSNKIAKLIGVNNMQYACISFEYQPTVEIIQSLLNTFHLYL